MSVSVKGLTKRFSSTGTPAVFDASFAAPAGAITTLLGPSGSGKTTVLRLIAGLERPDAGTVHVGERDFTRLPVRERGVGVVFQGYALFQHMTVYDNIAFPLKIQGVSGDERHTRITELLELVQLEGMGARHPDALSGGQRQRVAFARALASKPSVLLLDEPFGALDARVRLELRQWLHKLHRKTHMTTILVTHDQDEALELSEQVVVMHDGRVVQCGAPQEIYDRPATPFVASFIGTANVLSGTIAGGRAEMAAGSIAAPDGARDGTKVQAFVRPSEVRLSRPDEGTPAVALALVEGLTRVGGLVKVDLRLPSSEPMTVQLPRSEIDSLGIAEGDRVMVDLAGAKLFVEDYSI